MDNQSKTKDELIAELESLQRKYDNLKIITDNTSDVIWIMDSQMNYTYISPSIYNQRGYTPEEFLKLKQKEIYSESSLIKLKDTYEKHGKLSKSSKFPKDYFLTIELEHKCKNGSIAIGEVLINPLINDNGELIGIHGTTRNISERKRIENKLQQQNIILNGVAQATYSLLINENFNNAINNALLHLGDSIGIDRIYINQTHIDPITKILLFSLKYEWTNSTIKSFINKNKYIKLSFDEYAPNWFDILSKGDIVHGITKKHSIPEKSLLNEQGILSTLIVPIHAGTELWGFIGFDDCTYERIWSEGEISILKAFAASIGGAIKLEHNKENLIKSNEKAIASDRLKTCLLMNMSHELRTPMNGILGFAEILSEELKGENLEIAKKILISGKRLMKTLNTILELSQLESGVKGIEFKTTNITEEINNIIDEFQENASKKQLELVSIVRKNILCKTEPFLFSKIISNIIENAVKFTKEGGIVAEADVIEKNNNEFIEIKIKDTGIGIATENQQLIFDEFKQISEGYGRSYEGVGLGLTLAQKMINLLNGSINVESEIGIGSVFTITIPYKQEKHVPISVITNYIIKEKKNIFNEKELPLVLLVEDNMMNIELTIAFFKHTCKIDFATDAVSAITKAKENNYKAILLDINLSSDNDGLYALKEIRKIEYYSKTPIIAVTGYTLYGDKERLLQAGFSHYLPKPFTRDAITNLMNEVLK